MRFAIPVILILMFLTIGCSGGGSNISAPEPVQTASATEQSSHITWGLWQFSADPYAGTLDFVQLRTPDLHLNVMPFLEGPPLVYLTLETLQFNGNLIEADIGLRHPFLGLTEFTGFDVCGILISNGSVSGFTDADIVMAGSGDTRLLNPDGATRWWNPVEFQHNVGIGGYQDGVLGTPDSVANFNCTVNAFKFFCDDITDPDAPLVDVDVTSRCVFSAGQKNIRHYTIELGNDGLIFNYAVDASWQYPNGEPPFTAPDDFSPGANRVEAWNVSVIEVNNSLWNDGIDNGGSLSLHIELWDHFDAGLNTVYVESPGNFSAAGPLSPIDGGPGYSTYEVDITSATPDEESIDVIIIAESEATGYQGNIPGVPISAYFIHTADVSETGDTPPIAIAEVNPDDNLYICDPIEFDATLSYDPDGGDILTYEWDWDNDGVYDEEGDIVTHGWATVGIYYVQLRVWDDEGSWDTLDTPLEIDIEAIAAPTLLINIVNTFHSPYCSKVDPVENNAWVDCTQAAPVLDFGFYKIDNNQNVTKVFEKTGAGFFGMPGLFGFNADARKILAPDVLAIDIAGPIKIDMWDVDTLAAVVFNPPYDTTSGGIAFIGDADMFADLEIAVVTDTATTPYGRLVTWDYTTTTPTYYQYQTAEFPSVIEADYDGDRLFVFCRGNTGSGPTVEVWNAATWTKITSFQTLDATYPFMSDIDYDPFLNRLYIGTGTAGTFEIWDMSTYTHVQTVSTGYGAVAGVDHMGCAIYVTVPGHLLVYDANTYTLLHDVPAGPDPRIVSCNPYTHKIYVPDMSASSVYVYQG
jgi:hypothetical protein